MDAKEQIKEKLDISEVIREYLELRPAGGGNFKALCPFHHEKTPSLQVSRDKQIWHCFGCQKGGDIFTFVMEMQGLDFREALETLASKAGVTLEDRGAGAHTADKWLYELNDLACQYFEDTLQKHELGKVALQYLEARGIPLELAKTFRLGYAPDAWDNLIKIFGHKGFTPDRLQKAGLSKQSERKTYIDQFRGRLLIPIRDIRGRVQGFTARVLVSDDHGPKYLNSPETEVFKKRAVMFGIYEARSAIRLQDGVIITEGNLDVIASHKAGVEHIVASSGTALTADQLQILSRLTKKLFFCFDADAAGFRAAKKGIDLARAQGFEIRVIRLPAEFGKDPDEIVQKDPQIWRDLVANHISIMDFYLQEAVRTIDISTIEGKNKFLEELLPELAQFTKAVEETFWLQRMGDVLHTDTQSIRQQLAQVRQKTAPATPAAAPVINKPAPKPQPVKEPMLNRGPAAFIELLGLITQRNLPATEIITPAIVTKELETLYNSWLNAYNAPEASTDPALQKQTIYNLLLTNVSAPTAARAILLRLEDEADATEKQVQEHIDRLVTQLRKAVHEQQKQALEADIRVAEQSGDDARLSQLLTEYQKLISN